MDSLFDIDDDDVDLASRSRRRSDTFKDTRDEPRPLAPDHAGTQTAETEQNNDDEFNFDYMPARRAISPAAPFDLGLDQEVVVKRRTPKAKLDEERLLGSNGISKIRDELSKKIRFHGKGHELQDLGRFIELYQFWAHSLYPKAKFRDALKMIGKVGKTKSMKSHRRRLITETLPMPEYFDDANSDSDAFPLHRVSDKKSASSSNQNLFMDDSDYEIPDENKSMVHGLTGSRPAQGLQGVTNDIPDEMPMEEMEDMDDMDALEAMGMQM